MRVLIQTLQTSFMLDEQILLSVHYLVVYLLKTIIEFLSHAAQIPRFMSFFTFPLFMTKGLNERLN